MGAAICFHSESSGPDRRIRSSALSAPRQVCHIDGGRPERKGRRTSSAWTAARPERWGYTAFTGKRPVRMHLDEWTHARHGSSCHPRKGTLAGSDTRASRHPSTTATKRRQGHTPGTRRRETQSRRATFFHACRAAASSTRSSSRAARDRHVRRSKPASLRPWLA